MIYMETVRTWSAHTPKKSLSRSRQHLHNTEPTHSEQYRAGPAHTPTKSNLPLYQPPRQHSCVNYTENRKEVGWGHHSCVNHTTQKHITRFSLSLSLSTNITFVKKCTWVHKIRNNMLTLVLLNPDIPCLCKQCRSRSGGFWRSQLIWI